MKADQKQIVSIFILFVLVFSQFAIPQPAYAASTIYVAPGGLTSGTCSNWGTACDLQYALGIAVFDDELWVMQGTYMPTTTTDRNASFVLVDGVKIYGGFAGTETQLAQRNPTGNVTTLSGDIGLGGDTSDNSYHVVQAYSVSASAVLNGFTITNGNSNGGAGHGGGIFIQDSSPMFANLVISNNTASANGGGVYVLSLDTQRANYSSPTFTQVVISSNTAARGGGLYTQNSSPVLLDVTFNGNTATSGAGGGMNNQVLDEITDEYSIPLLTNVTFSGNTANGGGGLFNNHSYPLLTNVTFSGNTANIRGGAILNEGANPVLRNVTITGNTAPSGLGGAIRNIQNAVSTPSNPQIYNSILWGNGTDEITSDGTGSTTIVDSVVQGGFAGTNIVTGNPNLGGLANNGGNTQTHAISVGSSALNAGGVNSACAGTDQRNVSRPQGSSCDMGAYEFELANSYTDTTVADFNLGTVGACVVDGGIGDGALRLNIPTSTSCVFESRIFDAGAPVDWTTLASTTTLPAGTSVSFNVRTGNTVNPDITWTSWQGGGTLTNPGSRYIQYRATLTTTDMGQTPVLEDVTINYTTGSISILNSPSGTLTTWNNSFNWTGVDGATWYLLEVYTSMGAKVLYKWYTSAQTNCAAGTGCSLTPATSDLNLGNGDYQWRVLDYGAYGYGIWPVFKSFTLDTACYTLTAAVAPFGSGSVSVPLQSCTGGYTAGSVVQLQAVSGTGYKFLSWSGDASGTSSPTSIVMDGNKSVTANMRGNTPLTPTGALSNWDYAFSWTGLSDATWYLIEVETLGGTQVFYKWYTSLQTGCSGGTACSVTPTGLSLTTGDYKWRVLDYGAYGYGVHSTYKNFTLSGVACYTLTTNMSPGGSGDVTVPAQTCEEGYTAGSVIQLTAVPNTGYLLENWSGDASGTGNPVSVTMNSNKSVTANFKATPVLLSPSGTLTSWDNTFSWTGLSDATWYLLEVYASEGTQVLYKWYTSPQTGCSGGTACSVIPPETAGLANGNYKWRILDYGAYGYGIWTQYMNFTLNVTAVCGDILYVDVDSITSTPNGCSWGTSYKTLQDALSVAVSGKQIWVAEGTYYPDRGGRQSLGDRNASFGLKTGVAIYGGFKGNEAVLNARDKNPATNGTILSGDIGTEGVTSDNSYQVVRGDTVSSAAVLDGFTITRGNSNGSSGHGGGVYLTGSSPTLANLTISSNLATANGGGVYVITADNNLPETSYSRPSFTDVTFSGNTAARGGGMYSQNASPVLTRVVFTGNTASSGAGGGMNNQTLTSADAPSFPILTDVTFSTNTANGGGGMFISNSAPLITNATFNGNTANRRGGGILNENGGNPSLTNVTFYNNISNDNLTDPRGGGAIMNITSSPILNNVTFNGNNSLVVGGDAIRNAVNSNPVIRNSILWGDVNDEITSDGTGTTTISDSVVQGGFASGTNIVTTNPNLLPLANNGGFTQTMALGAGSSAVDAGNNSYCGIGTSDQRGTQRPQGLVCDIGSYELDVVLLIAPLGTIGSWDNTFSWTGQSDATWYLLEVYTSTGTQVLYKWYTSSQTDCASGVACTASPPETADLANGNYKWRILEYGDLGYGVWTPYMNFSLNP